jgi:hypothetical protein
MKNQSLVRQLLTPFLPYIEKPDGLIDSLGECSEKLESLYREANTRQDKNTAPINSISSGIFDRRSTLSLPDRKVVNEKHAQYVTSWLRNCDLRHGEFCNTSAIDSLRGLKWVVDVQDMCIVPWDKEKRYLALSYV